MGDDDDQPDLGIPIISPPLLDAESNALPEPSQWGSIRLESCTLNEKRAILQDLDNAFQPVAKLEQYIHKKK